MTKGKSGTYSGTDDIGYRITETSSTCTTSTPPSYICFGIEHTKLTFKHQGREYRLTDVEGKVVRGILS
jgi:hypothetical protein